MLFQEAEATASAIQLWGAVGFGAIIGWFVYFINRYRGEDVSWSDLTTIIGIIGGGSILTLFPASTDLFGAYGIGLFVGFFGYFLFLLVWVKISANFSVDWFLDGRRIPPEEGKETIPDIVRQTVAAMAADDKPSGDRG